MKNAEYSFWYERAKRNTDVEKVSKHFFQHQEAVKECLSYIQKEEEAWDSIIHSLEAAGFDYADIEDTVLRYGGVIQSVYLELGVKIGARLGAEKLINKM